MTKFISGGYVRKMHRGSTPEQNVDVFLKCFAPPDYVCPEMIRNRELRRCLGELEVFWGALILSNVHTLTQSNKSM